MSSLGRASQVNREDSGRWSWGFPDGSVGKESACNAGDTGDVVQSLGQEDPLQKENGNPLQYSCPENPMNQGAFVGYSHKEITRVRHD